MQRQKQLDAEQAYGGMRRPSKVNDMGKVSGRLRSIAESYLKKRPHVQRLLIQAIGGPKGAFDYAAAWISELRALWAAELQVHDSGPVEGQLVSTPIRYHLVKAWLTAAADPAAQIIDWLVDGAPAGITRPIPDIGAFPSKPDSTNLSPDELDDVA